MNQPSMHLIEARQRFQRLIAQPEAQFDLAAAALCIAQEEYANLDIDHYLRILDHMAETLRSQLPRDPYPLRIVRAINHYLFEQEGFQGNSQDYYDPDNSFLNIVLDRRKGIPITLSLVYLELAKRIQFPMVGINMPGHFLIRPDQVDIGFLVDPFHQGDLLFLEDCQERLTAIYGEPVAIQPSFLEQSDSRSFLARILTNLKMIYLQRREFHKALAAIERMLLLFPESPNQRRDRGILYYHLGNWIDARQDLQAYLEQVPGAEDWVVIRQLLSQMGQI